MTTFIQPAGSRRGHVVLPLLAFVLLLIGSGGAWAGTCSSGGGQTITITLPPTVTVPRDAPVGSLLTGWVTTPAVTNYFHCSVNAEMVGLYVVPGPLFTGSSGMHVPSASGNNAYVYETNVPGIGMAFEGRAYLSVSCAGWGPWNHDSSVTTVDFLGCIFPTASNDIGAQFGVALVKTGAVVATGGVITGGQVASTYPVAGTSFTNLSNYFVTTPITIVALACTTPDVWVPMGSHPSTEFTGIGPSTATPVGFTVNLNGCPGGLGTFGPAIQYRIDATTAIVDSSQSVVALDGSSSTSGVGVQLLDSAGTAAFPLGTYQTFSGYNASTGGSYTIPFKARYYQTGSMITPGAANTSMTFTMAYQ
ncbi:fimbrial protein [Dyella sp. EPa41]|uniref:fimbrial protein n=1 Tax=Dyella sp. EPa41 TaxID=1561194 RepID=UPI001F2A0158|nr:fimbrial protein [Dyella sp. EPa41]